MVLPGPSPPAHTPTRRHALSQLVFLLTSQLRIRSCFGSDFSPAPQLQLPPLEEGKRRLYLARHGETDWNVLQRIQGATDNPLNANGRAQAEALSTFLRSTPLDLIASSSLSRAKATADLVSTRHPRARRVVEPRFGEMCFGSLEGEVPALSPAYAATLAKWERGETGARWPGAGGESCEEVAARGLEGLKALGVFDRSACRHTLIVAHSRFNKIVIAALQGDLSKCNAVPQGNTCLNVLDIDRDGTIEVRALNLQDHLALLQPS